MKHLLILPLLVLFVLCCGFTLAPPRYTVTIPPGESISIPYQLGADSPGSFVITTKADDTFNPLPTEWLSIPNRVSGDSFEIRLSVPRNANPDDYSIWISVTTSEGMVRTELRSRLLVTVTGEPVRRIPWVLIGISAALILLVLVLVVRRRRYA